MAWKSQRGKEIFSIGLWTGQLGVGHKEGVQIQAMDMGEAFHHPPPPGWSGLNPIAKGRVVQTGGHFGSIFGGIFRLIPPLK